MLLPVRPFRLYRRIKPTAGYGAKGTKAITKHAAAKREAPSAEPKALSDGAECHAEEDLILGARRSMLSLL